VRGGGIYYQNISMPNSKLSDGPSKLQIVVGLGILHAQSHCEKKKKFKFTSLLTVVTFESHYVHKF
jgi:hypothetical protein